MSDINLGEYRPDNFLAGSFPIATDIGAIKAGAAIHKWAPLSAGEDGLEETTAATLDKLAGIAADEPNGEEVVYYLTGEFFADALTFPDGVTVETLKPALRKLGIFLR